MQGRSPMSLGTNSKSTGRPENPRLLSFPPSKTMTTKSSSSSPKSRLLISLRHLHLPSPSMAKHRPQTPPTRPYPHRHPLWASQATAAISARPRRRSRLDLIRDWTTGRLTKTPAATFMSIRMEQSPGETERNSTLRDGNEFADAREYSRLGVCWSVD